MIPSARIGFTTVYPEYKVILSEVGGAYDLVSEFKDEVVRIRENRDMWYRPIPFYIGMGETGMLHVEVLTVYVYGGIPYILSSTVSVDGQDEFTVSYKSDGERFIDRVFRENNLSVMCIGAKPDGMTAYKYAKQYVKRSPLMPDATVNQGIARSVIDSSAIQSSGVIFMPGGHRYDIFCLSSAESMAIRVDKDYRRDPMSEGRYADGEVILLGGFPDIVPLGQLVSTGGWVFNVWVPNDVNDYAKASEMYMSDYLPRDVFDIETDDMEELYAMICKHASDTDISNHLDDEADDGDTSNLV